MPQHDLKQYDRFALEGVQDVDLINDNDKPAYVDIAGDGIAITKTVGAGETVPVPLHGNAVTFFNKSKPTVVIDW